MVRDFINVNEVSKQLENNYVKVMLDSESHYRGQLFKIANTILKHRKKFKMILLGGPSCSGKTTTANLLKGIIESKHRKAIVISMDDFFVDREKTPLLPNGMKNYDGLCAVNLEQMEECFSTFYKKGEAKFPRYNFETGLNEKDYYKYSNKDNPIIIFEGIHVLNPELISHLGINEVFKVYISTLSGFKGDNGTIMSTRQVRFVRRMIRDSERRSTNPEKALKTWQNVCDAEDTYIAPYKEDVNFKIDTTHRYEVALYKTEFFKIMAEYRDILNSLSFLYLFDETVSLSRNKLPDTTLMWEFISKDKVI